MPFDALSSRDHKRFGIPFWLTSFLRTFPCFLLNCTITILIFILVFVFPLLGDKERFKFGGVMSIEYTQFIPMFLCYFCSF